MRKNSDKVINTILNCIETYTQSLRHYEFLIMGITKKLLLYLIIYGFKINNICKNLSNE